MWTRSELEASKNSSREVTMPLPPPSYLVFSILFASTKLSLLKWQQRPEAEGIISRPLSPPGAQPTWAAKRALFCGFSWKPFLEENRKNLYSQRPFGQNLNKPFPRGSRCFPPDFHRVIKEVFLGAAFENGPLPLLEGLDVGGGAVSFYKIRERPHIAPGSAVNCSLGRNFETEK